MNKQLNQIKALMRAGESAEAEQQLKIYLHDNPEDAQGWYLASFLHPTPQTRFEAIRRAAQFNPTQPDIQKRLAKLRSSESPHKRSYWLPILIIVILGISGVLVLGFIGGKRANATVSDLPTLAILPTINDTPTQQIAIHAVTEEVTPTTVPQTFQPQVAVSETASSSVEVASVSTATLSQSINPIAIVNPEGPTQIFIQPGNPLPPPTAAGSIPQTTAVTPTSVSSAPTLTPVVLSTIPATSIPSATPVYQNVLLNNIINLAVGQFRVVDATIGAERTIQDLGGTFSPAPVHQSWVLLELLLVCQKGTPCTFNPSVLKIVGSSGTTYSASNQLYSIPIFGTLTQDSQIWGYMGFTIPTSENQLKLILTENSQTYAVALE